MDSLQFFTFILENGILAKFLQIKQVVYYKISYKNAPINIFDILHRFWGKGFEIKIAILWYILVKPLQYLAFYLQS